ncbi:MAG: glycosyltransferase family 4 protein [Verrucomicrobiota bacterium]
MNENQPIRVVFLLGTFFQNAKGACYAAERLAIGLRDEGVELQLFVDSASGWNEEERYRGFPVWTFFLQGSGKWKKFCALCRIVWLLTTGKVPCDIFHIHGGGHMHLIVAWLVQRLAKKPVLFKITLNGWDTPDGIRQYKWGWVTLRAFMALEAVVAMTSGQEETCRLFGYSGKLKVIANAVDTQRFCPATSDEKRKLRESLGLDVNSTILCYAGVLDHRKGTDLLLEAFQALSQEVKEPIHLLLVGDFKGGDRTRDELKTLANRLGVDSERIPWDHVTVQGRVKNVEDYMKLSDIFVFPSRQEGFGTVQIEAMACGLPCVVGNIPGVTCDIFEADQTGLIMKTYSVDSLKDCLQKLIADPVLRNTLGHHASEDCRSRFGLPTIAQTYCDYYRQILN